jgi:putative endonuclease
MERSYFVYIMGNRLVTTLYVGVTNNLIRRAHEHKTHFYPGSFTSQYHLSSLLYFEETNDIGVAIHREKQLKRWNRKWKLELIQTTNPRFVDLAEGWLEKKQAS